MSAPKQSTGGPPEAQLLDYVHQLERSYFEWRAAYLHLSRLRPNNRHDYQLRVAASEFEPLLERHQGHLFRLTDGDMVVFCKGASVAEIDEAVLRLRYLFSDDPLLSDAPPPDDDEAGGDGGEPESRLCTWYDLATDYHALCHFCEDLLAAIERRLARPRAQAAATKPLTARTLAQIEGGLGGLDFAALLRRQPICAMVASQPPQAVFTELYVAIDELAKALAPGIDLTAAKWLFQHLTEALDRYLLAAVAGDGGGAAGPVSLNLNVATLLSPAFTQFSSQLRDGGRRERFLIELQLVDIFAELGPYVFARDMVRSRGHMVCIDGVHHLNLPLIDRRRLGADFVKLQWSPDLLDDVSEERREELRVAVRRAGVDRVILCRCGSPDAVRWGQELGVRLFQGRYVDSRLRSQRPPSVAAARQALRAAAG